MCNHAALIRRSFMSELTQGPTALIALAITIAAANLPARAQRPDSTPSAARRLEPEKADSIVLERTACYGYCPVYRLRVGREGEIALQWRARDGKTHLAEWKMQPDSVRMLLNAAQMEDLTALPDRIADSKAYCPTQWTDHPTAIVSFFGPGWSKRIVDYYGCRWAPGALRDFEQLVDAFTGVRSHMGPS